MTGPRPTRREAGLLVHAICERIARDEAVRVLAIKGPVLALQGLRHARASADVDVLVHPDDFERFVATLKRAGWYEAVETTVPQFVRPHALNLLHLHWPVGIDIHHRFPGFLAPDREAFSALWVRRTSVELAGMPITACDVVSHVAVVGLHLLREDAEGSSPRVRDLISRANERLGATHQDQLFDLAVQTDAVVTLRPILLGLGLTRAGNATTSHLAELEAWLDEATANPGSVWGRQFRTTRWWRWPALLWHSATLTNAEIDAYHGGDTTRTGRLRARFRRLTRGVALVPGIVSGYRSEQRHRTPTN